MGRRRRVRVVGESMAPTLHAGDVVFVDPRIGSTESIEGAIVVARHPHRLDLELVKRACPTDEGGRILLLSDNADAVDAIDSRTFGPIDRSLVVGLVSSRIRRA
ncbi:MAG: nickel-type superoxide dismutase maturation protease [Acidimicrobiia bacterium]|nr:nickel-type superoxide dismutase maturation protease [Acidimicrobiia bacterium]